jgi:thiamine kinase-like enzyme
VVAHVRFRRRSRTLTCGFCRACNTLLHYDLSAGNLLVSGGRVRVVDWSFAARGTAWLDGALFAPRLVQARHTPEKADELLSALPHWRDAPRKAVIGVAAAWTLFRLYKAQYRPAEVREARARAGRGGPVLAGLSAGEELIRGPAEPLQDPR